ALDIRHPVVERTRGGGRTRQALRSGRVFLERHEVVPVGAELDAEVDHEVVDGARRLKVAMYRILYVDRAISGDGAILAGQQHRPFRKWHEDGIVPLELQRQFDLAVPGVEPHRLDVILQPAKNGSVLIGIETRDLEVGGQRDLQYVDLFIRRADRLWIGAA